ncbi:cyclin-domain-containing protein [Wilcoxina mikolae CBS 423.85]|nr:cyclin-domain-containing protein [Wilcoxina mikolae CBS 423.85]
MTSPFTSPPPPYSPEHPHVILDHEKVPAIMADLPPPLCEIGAEESPKPRGLRGKDGDIFHLTPSAALTLLARYVELLVSMTGDLLPTPPPSNPNTPSGTYTERRNSEGGYYFGPPNCQNVDGIRIRSPMTSPACEVRFDCREASKVIHHGGVDDTTHYGTIARKFWSKSAPEIPIEDYLFRIQRFCPLSTAVYLAASYYLHRLAISDQILPLTRLNVHRLLLAALRIAAKTLEDLSYPHTRFAKVGGLSDLELSKLEVSFCFLMDFELKVDRAMLQCHADLLRRSVEAQAMLGKDGLVRMWSA